VLLGLSFLAEHSAHNPVIPNRYSGYSGYQGSLDPRDANSPRVLVPSVTDHRFWCQPSTRCFQGLSGKSLSGRAGQGSSHAADIEDWLRMSAGWVQNFAVIRAIVQAAITTHKVQALNPLGWPKAVTRHSAQCPMQVTYSEGDICACCPPASWQVPLPTYTAIPARHCTHTP
jgi:hypothetical protein